MMLKMLLKISGLLVLSVFIYEFNTAMIVYFLHHLYL